MTENFQDFFCRLTKVVRAFDGFEETCDITTWDQAQCIISRLATEVDAGDAVLFVED